MLRSREDFPGLDNEAWGTVGETASTFFSRASFRELVSALQLNVGSLVLLVGRPTHGLAGRMRDLGIDLVCWAPSSVRPEGDEAAAASWPDDLPVPGPRPHEKFAGVVVAECNAFGSNLFDARSFQLTARLLTALRPNGTLAFVSGSGRPGALDGHSVSCYARHLSFFPGVCRVSHLPNGTADTLLARLGLRPGPHFWRLAALKVPAQPIPPTTWHRLAEEAARCCRGEPCHASGPAGADWRRLPEAA